MSTLHLIAAFVVFASGVFFLVYGIKSSKTYVNVDDYLLASKTVNGKTFANTFFATGMGLANIIFFIEFHKEYGYLVALFPTIMFATKFFILQSLKNTKVTLSNQYRTLADLCYGLFGSKILAKTISIISATTSFMAVFVELCIGSVILSIFLPDTAEYRAAAFCLMGLIVLGYVYYGGYRAVVKTDSWQLKFMMIASFAIIIFVIYIPFASHNNIAIDKNFFLQLFSFQDSGMSLIWFVAWAFIVNICFCYTDPTVWQRVNASVSHNEAFRELYRGFWKVFVVMWLPILGFVALYLKGYDYNSLPEFLNLLTLERSWIGYIAFLIIILGFSAALFSTADTNMIAAIYSISDTNNFSKKKLTIMCIILVLLISIMYYLQDSNVGDLIMPFLYAVWNQLSILAPIAIYALYRLSRGLPVIKLNTLGAIILSVSLAVSWAIILYGSWRSVTSGDYSCSHITFLIGLLIVICSLPLTLAAVKLQKNV